MDHEEKDSLLQIDLAHLEKDSADHARLVRIWGDKLAEAERNAKLLKNKIRIVKADISKLVRANPGNYKLLKVTEDSVEDVVVTTQQYKDAFQALVDAEYDRDLIKNMVISLHERGEAIGNAVKLHGQMYWAKPQTETEYSRADVMAEAAEEAMPRRKK